MGATGADHLLPVVIMNPKGSSVLRMNERCEPQWQASISDSARQGWLSGIFTRPWLIRVALWFKESRRSRYELWKLGHWRHFLGIGLRNRSQDMIVLVRSTASQTTFSEMVRKNITGGLACRLWNGVVDRGLVPEGREIVSFICAMSLE